jgi:hypothetical protein
MRRFASVAAAMIALLAAGPAVAQERPSAVAGFSILGDLVRNVAGDWWAVDVPPFRYSEEPIPAVAARVAAAIGVLLLAALALGLLSWLGLRGPVTP